MTLRFSSFSIKDILTGRDARRMPGVRSTEGLCAPKRHILTEHGCTRVPDPSDQGAEGSCIQSERLPADLSLSIQNLSEESVGEKTEHREGEQFYFGQK